MTWSSPPKFKFALKISVKKVKEEVFKEPFAQPGQHEEALRILKENKEHAADCNMLGDCGVAALPLSGQALLARSLGLVIINPKQISTN